MGDDVIEEFEVVVAGDAEDLGNPEFGQAVEQIVTDGVGVIQRATLTRTTVRVCGRKRRPPGAASLSCGPWQSRNPRHRHRSQPRGDPGRHRRCRSNARMVGTASERGNPRDRRRRPAQQSQDEGQNRGHHRRTGGGLHLERQRGDLDAGQLRPAEGAGRQVHLGAPAKGDSTLVKFEISVDPNVPLPGFVLKRAVKGTIDSATKELRKRVLKVKKGE